MNPDSGPHSLPPDDRFPDRERHDQAPTRDAMPIPPTARESLPPESLPPESVAAESLAAESMAADVRELDDSDLHGLFQQHYASPPLSSAQRARIVLRVQQAAAARHAGRGATEPASVKRPTVERPTGARQPQPADHHGQTPRRSWRLIGGLLGIVAALLGLVLFLPQHPAYSWARMLQAWESQPWIQAEMTPNAFVTPRTQWVSVSRRIAVIQTANQVVMHDLEQGIVEDFRPAEQTLYRKELPQTSRGAIPQPVAALLAPGFGPWQEADGPVMTVDRLTRALVPVRQAWREVHRDRRRWIELTVSFATPQATGTTHSTYVFELDPTTHLPSACYQMVDPTSATSDRLDGDTGNSDTLQSGADQGEPGDRPATARVSLRFTYPASAPTRWQDFSDNPQVTVVLGDGPPVGVSANSSIAEADPPSTSNGSSLLAEPLEVHRLEPLATDPPADNDPSPRSSDEAPQENVARSADRAPLLPPLSRDDRLAQLSPAAMAEQIDQRIARLWSEQGLVAAQPASDTEFLRRVYLDLVGRIPTIREVRDFLEADSATRRQQTSASLLSQWDHAAHLAAMWRRMLIPEQVNLNTLGGSNELERWLMDHFARDVPYDQLVRQLLLAEGRAEDSGPVLFFTALKMNPEEIAAQTSRAFLGMRIDCAQCHDHPFDTWSQRDFWGFAAFFARISRPAGKMEMVPAVLQVRDSRAGEVTLPNTSLVIPPKFPEGPISDADQRGVARRLDLVQWMTAADNPYFARALVNRVWWQLFGVGIVDPVDNLSTVSLAPVSLELLDELARYFVATGYDLDRLYQTLVLTRAYQLSSQGDSADPRLQRYFAQHSVKPFSAEQLYDCIATATLGEVQIAGDEATGLIPRSDNARQQFLELFRTTGGAPTDFQHGIAQALTLINGAVVHQATGLKTSPLLRSLQAPFFTHEQRLETLYLATLSRLPRPEEQQALQAWLASTTDPHEQQQILSDIAWALLNSAEFVMNH